jgi:hypothetical protein
LDVRTLFFGAVCAALYVSGNGKISWHVPDTELASDLMWIIPVKTESAPDNLLLESMPDKNTSIGATE